MTTRYVYYNDVGRLTHFEDWEESALPELAKCDNRKIQVSSNFTQKEADQMYAPPTTAGMPRVLCRKPPMPFKVPGRALRTAGRDKLDIPDELAGGQLYIQYLDCGETSCATSVDRIEKGTTLTFNRPGEYRVRIVLFPFRDFEVIIHATD